MFISVVGDLGVIHGADRMAVAVEGARARHLVEGQLGAGGDDQIVIIERLSTLHRDPVVLGVDVNDRPADEMDASFFKMGTDRERDIAAPTPADQQPGVGRDELKFLAGVDNRDVVGLAQFFPGLQSLKELIPAQSGGENPGPHEFDKGVVPPFPSLDRKIFYLFYLKRR